MVFESNAAPLPRHIADVVRSSSLEGVAVVPHSHIEPREVVALIRRELPNTRSRRTANGTALSMNEALTLRDQARVLPFRWTAPALQYVKNREWARGNMKHVLEAVQRLRETGRAGAVEMFPELARESPLDDHQVVNVAAMTLRGSPGLCLFDEQGAGKTVSMIYAFDALVRRDEVDLLLIAAPKSMVGEWPKDFSRFTNDLYRVEVVVGTSRQKLAAIASRADVLITNFETVVAFEDQFEALLRSYNGRASIAVDESFFIKSPEARRTMALRRLREWCARGYVLCGTPAPNSPADIVEQFNFADFGTTFDGVEVPDDRTLALPVVQAVINERGPFIRNLKSDVLPDLPTKSYERVMVQLEPKQASLYVKALSALVDDLENTSDIEFKRSITNFLSQRSLLLQICSNPAATVQDYVETPAKLLALDQVIEKYVGVQGEKIVIWSFYTATIDSIMFRYGAYGAVRYDGKVVSVEERRDAVTRFQTDDATRIFVANPAAAGAGLTLHRARAAVYESMSNQAAHYLQSLDRIHRRGQERAVEYIVLLCQDTIEEAEYQRLLNKEASAQELLGDIVDPPVVRTSMLLEATALLDRFKTGPSAGYMRNDSAEGQGRDAEY